MTLKNSYSQALNASYLGYVVQAVANSFAPLLLLTFQKSYGMSLAHIVMLVTMNSGVQLAVDLLSARFVDRIGYRTCIMTAHVFAALGLVGLSFLPDMVPGHFGGLLARVALYAVGGDIIEVLISPVVETCPTAREDAAMSLLHSFYCWGPVTVVILSTVFFQIAGLDSWRVLALLWAAVPVINAVLFSWVPILALTEDGQEMGTRGLLKGSLFWLFVSIMVCTGASEQAISQWTFAFAESGLNVSKTMEDLAGPCMFSILMDTSRAIYARYSQRIRLTTSMTGSTILCIFSYGLASIAASPVPGLAGCGLYGFSVGILWPGAFSLTSMSCPRSGIVMFALLTLAGDLGCADGPTLVGLIAGVPGGNLRADLIAVGWIPTALAIGLLKIMYNNREKQYTQ